ncbi:MAG: hypothetical protein LH614_09635 [Pyrinomonadaceae bacterium]|nr:hypothetical protein [Pyrinomonadaceae bacterium]
MDTFLHEQETKKSRLSGVLIGALLVAASIVAGGLWLLTFQPNREEQQQLQMVGAFMEGTPEFDNYTKQLVITTDFDRTTESPLGLGTIQMSIHGTIRNKGAKVINGLEVTVSVVDKQNKIIKAKKTMVVPNQAEILQPSETIPVFVPMDGFSKEDDRANIRWKVSAIRFQ